MLQLQHFVLLTSAEKQKQSSSSTFCHRRMWGVLLLLCLAMANKRTGRHQIALTIQMCNLCRLISSPGSGLRLQTMTPTIWCVWQLFIVPQTKRKLLLTDPDAFGGYAGHLSGCPSISLYCNYASNPYGSCRHNFCWVIPPLATWCPSNFGAKQTLCHV